MNTTSLTRTAGAAAVAAGVIFIGVQVDHPHLDATSIATTEVIVRNCLKVVMAVLALAGITGMYLSQARRNGLLGLVGYLLLALGYLLIMCSTFVAAFVLPAMTATDPAYVTDVIAATTGGTPTGDIGVLSTVIRIQDLRTWPAVSSSASPCSGHESSPAGRARCSPSVASSRSSCPCCPTPSTGCWRSPTASP
jgi:hypothetical protein